MYKDKRFCIRQIEDILKDIEEMSIYSESVEKVFLADGNALCLSTDALLTIFDSIHSSFPRCRQISLYGAPKDILGKSDEELKKLSDAGLSMIYMGVESGYEEILEKTCKGATPAQIEEAGKRISNTPIKLSVTLISGLGGKALWREHAQSSAALINGIQPEFVSLLTLMVTEGTVLYDEVKRGEFTLLEAEEVIKEIKLLVENLDLKASRFSCNHASNFIPLSGQLPEDKEQILAILDEAIEGRRTLKPEARRGL